MVADDPKRAADLLKLLLRTGKGTSNYILGGEVGRIDCKATAVNPYLYKAVWQIETFDEEVLQMVVREAVKDSGVSYNHASKIELNWRQSFWGSNLNRLECLKKRIDGCNRLNCWYCIGYKGPEI